MAARATTVWELVRGEPSALMFRFHEGDVGTPLDLGGRTYRLHLRPFADSETYTAATVTVVDAPGGEMTVSVTAEQTEDIAWNLGIWSLEETVSGVPGTIIDGDVLVRADVTR